MRERYGRRGRQGRSRLIDEVCELCGYGRKHAIKILGRKLPIIGRTEKRGGPRLRYGEKERTVLKGIWLAAEQPCGKRLKEAVALWLPHYEVEQGVLEQAVRERVLAISPASIDRLLAPCRVALGSRVTALNHLMDIEWLKEAYTRLRKASAPGVDGQRVVAYGENLESNLEKLLGAIKSGRYVAPPVKRVHIPKGDGQETRPIGIPTIEDKLVQRAVVMVLEPIYEQDFMDCSCGFRPGRSAHQALEDLWQQAMDQRVKWVLDVDIKSFFDTLDHSKLREIIDRRVGDGVIGRLIGKWLKAGVMEQGEISYREEGTPQGGVISPMLIPIRFQNKTKASCPILFT